LLDRFRDPADPLKFVIVTASCLTGFDAPILQVMYLDKPMKDHNLLQAICRTNRTFGQEKTHGLIVDYIGIFDDVARRSILTRRPSSRWYRTLMNCGKHCRYKCRTASRSFPVWIGAWAATRV
jgi:superfamily II DNA or RNA helicase